MKRYKPFFIEGSPLTISKTQDEINNEFKDKITKYAPELKNISYQDIVTKYRDIVSLINNFYYKEYQDTSQTRKGILIKGKPISIMQFWSSLVDGDNPLYPNAKIKKIISIGNKKYAYLSDEQKVHITPNNLVSYIAFRLNK